MSTLAAAAPPPSPPAYKDRRWLLILAGVVELLMALVALGFVAIFFLASAVGAKQPPPPGMSLGALRALVSLFYGAIAIFLIVVAIGSILAKNWARITGLVAAWFWLAMGVLGTLMAALIMPAAIHQAERQAQSAPPPALFFAIFFTVIAALYVGVPLAFVLIYSNRNVRMTCLARSGQLPVAGVAGTTPGVPVITKPSYPVAVGILVGWLAFGILVSIPALLLVHTRAYPFFGTFVYGITARALPLVLVAVHAFFVWHLYKLRPLGWWGTLAFQVVLTASAMLTMWRYGAVGYLLKISPELQDNPGFPMMPLLSKLMPAIIVFGSTAVVVYLLCIRRYFQPSAPASRAAAV